MLEQQTQDFNDFSKLVRMVEAVLFASSELITVNTLEQLLPEGWNTVDIQQALETLMKTYSSCGVHLVKIDEAYAFRTAADLAFLFNQKQENWRKLSRAALEVLAIIAYHQPVTRAELEDIRGVETSKGTLDVLMEARWVKMRGRRRTPGRPVTYGTTQVFLDHFSLSAISDLPGLEELKGAGLLSLRPSCHFEMPTPLLDLDNLTEDEEAFDDDKQDK